jgi:hypothetical protein
MRGAKPKENKHGRTPTVHEWIEVPNRPYRGKTASLPDKRTVGYVDGKPVTLALHAQTRAWWRDLCSMPHCVLWTATDWRFAVETALVADMFFQGDRMAGAELRIREKVLGTTFDARRDLRIRYVDAPVDVEKTTPASVTSIDARRRRLSGAS